MTELFATSPVSMVLIFVTLGLVFLVGILGWRHSSHTRKLVIFAALLFLFVVSFFLIHTVFRLLFPFPPS